MKQNIFSSIIIEGIFAFDIFPLAEFALLKKSTPSHVLENGQTCQGKLEIKPIALDGVMTFAFSCGRCGAEF